MFSILASIALPLRTPSSHRDGDRILIGPSIPNSGIVNVARNPIRHSLKKGRRAVAGCGDVAFIPILLSSGGPSAVVRRIGAIVVNAIQCGTRWARAHISKKCRRVGQPSFANDNTSASVSGITGIVGVQTPLLHGVVGFKCRCDAPSRSLVMTTASRRSALLLETAAARRVTSPQRVGFGASAPAAVAIALPKEAPRPALRCGHLRNNSQAPKAQANQICLPSHNQPPPKEAVC